MAYFRANYFAAWYFRSRFIANGGAVVAAAAEWIIRARRRGRR